MSGILLIFHSRTGTARKVALDLANAHDWAIGEVRPRHVGTGFAGCMAQALLRLRPAIDYDGPDPSAFDLVVLVAPVWCGTLSAPLRSFLARFGAAIHAHVVFLVIGGNGAAGAFRAIDRLLGRSAHVKTALSQADVDGDHHGPAMGEFARRVLAVLEQVAPEAVRQAA